MSREALAVAHSTGNLRDVILAAGHASPLAIDTLRYLDNGDQRAYQHVLAVYTRLLRRSGKVGLGIERGYARNVVKRVLEHMRDQRCKTCAGTGSTPTVSGVVMPCPNRDCQAGQIPRGVGWNSRHEAAAKIIRSEIAAALSKIRSETAAD